MKIINGIIMSEKPTLEPDDMDFINECLFYEDMDALFIFLQAITDKKHIRYNEYRNCIEIYFNIPKTDQQIREALTPLPVKKDSYDKILDGAKLTYNVGTTIEYKSNKFDEIRKKLDEIKEMKRQNLRKK